VGVSALAGTIAAPMAARRHAPAAPVWLRSILSLLVAVGILAVALPVTFGSVNGGRGAGTDPLQVFSSSSAVAVEAGGGARLSVAGLVPGQSRTATIRLSNSGSGPVPLFLSTRLDDRVGPGGVALSTLLSLSIASPGGAVLYSGSLDDLPRLGLGRIGAGASRAFELIVALPSGAGNGVEGSALSAGFSWTAG